MHVRKAAIFDAEHVSVLITELGYPTTEAAMRKRLAAILPDPNRVTLIAEDDTGVVGVAGAQADKPPVQRPTGQVVLSALACGPAPGHRNEERHE